MKIHELELRDLRIDHFSTENGGRAAPFTSGAPLRAHDHDPRSPARRRPRSHQVGRDRHA
jgi:hypothetical protein